jgi:peptidoglycan biosynthesis protein MviN/MurJ (putative lipid II flippase)
VVEDFIFDVELILVGFLMTLVTLFLFRLMDRVFGKGFTDEKWHLRTCLAIFITTYIVHAAFFWVMFYWKDSYLRWRDQKSYLLSVLCISGQLIYDFLPLLMIFRQHHIHFKNEDRESTIGLMRYSNATSYFEDRRATLKLIERLTQGA